MKSLARMLEVGLARAGACVPARSSPPQPTATTAAETRSRTPPPPPDPRYRNHTERGFTLLEVLVATAILGVAITTLLGLHARNLNLVAEAEELTVAGTLAGNVLALARIEPVLEDGVVRGTFSVRPGDADGKTVVYGGPRSEPYTWTREVLPTALPTLRQVHVFVTRGDDTRAIAELWAAVPLKGAR